MFYPIGFGGHGLLYILVPAILGIWAQIRVTGAFNRWGKVRASSNITGAECAREILQAAQIHDVDVVETNDFLGDHYDPTKKKLCLSSNVYNTPSVAALGIAAHETGHAIQHAKAYAPLKARMAIVPMTMVASQMLPFIIIGGLWFRITGLITLGIYCYLILAIFQLITLPVEFDASRRA
jgi:Zn-dependent membrane protease YugP